MTRPWLSVIMPTFNGAEYVGHALESVARQNDGTIEVIAVDDGSTDETRSVLSCYASRLPIKLIERPHCGNWVESTALGMSLACGEYLCWLHQDDLWQARRLASLRRVVAANPTAALIVHPSWYIDAAGRRIGYWHCPLPRRNRLLNDREVLERLLVQCFVAAPATLFRADAVRQVGLPDARLTYSADWDYWLRLARLGRTVYHAMPLTCFRIHAASQTIAQASEADLRRSQQLLVLDRHLSAFEGRHPDAQRVARVARFSIELNHALACAAAGRPVTWRKLTSGFLGLGPFGWRRLFRDSRVVERCLSRIQALGVRPVMTSRKSDVGIALQTSPHALAVPLAADLSAVAIETRDAMTKPYVAAGGPSQ